MRVAVRGELERAEPQDLLLVADVAGPAVPDAGDVVPDPRPDLDDVPDPGPRGEARLGFVRVPGVGGEGEVVRIVDRAHDVRERQQPLRQKYLDSPAAARITDRGRTDGGVTTDPFHGFVIPGSQDYGITWPFGIHHAVGGYHDAPNPGDLLCAALAACLDSTLRIVAARLGVRLISLEVDVTADVDVRGTLMLDRSVPVGFQGMRCAVRLRAAEGTDVTLVQKLVTAAEQSCVNLQTLRAGVPVETYMMAHIGHDMAAVPRTDAPAQITSFFKEYLAGISTTRATSRPSTRPVSLTTP